MKDKLLSFLPFYRWHPEVAIRCLPIVAELNRLGNPSVLEIGSGGLGITPYLGRKVTGLDTHFSVPIHPLLEKRVGSGLAIPFPNKSFDVVIAVDTLEHVPAKNRPKILFEMARVARQEIIIAVPTGKQAELQDQELDRVYKKLRHSSYKFLEEQIHYGLPKIEEITTAIVDNVKVSRNQVRTVGNEPLPLRDFLLRGWMKPGLLSRIFYWKILILALPLFKLFDRPPYYRTIFFVKLST